MMLYVYKRISTCCHGFRWTYPPLHSHSLLSEFHLTDVVFKRVNHEVVPAVGPKLKSAIEKGLVNWNVYNTYTQRTDKLNITPLAAIPTLCLVFCRLFRKIFRISSSRLFEMLGIALCLTGPLAPMFLWTCIIHHWGNIIPIMIEMINKASKPLIFALLLGYSTLAHTNLIYNNGCKKKISRTISHSYILNHSTSPDFFIRYFFTA